MENLIIIGLMVITVLFLITQIKFTNRRTDHDLQQRSADHHYNVMGATKFVNEISTLSDDSTSADNDPAWTEEEEDLQRYAISTSDNSLAQGVTFEELSSADAFLYNQTADQIQHEAAARVFRQLQGTDLFNLLQNSSEGAAEKISTLLDKVFKEESQITAEVQKNSWDDFDIEEFI